MKRGKKQGDLYVRFLVRLPSKSSKEIEKAIETLEKAMDADIRSNIRA